MTSIEHLVGLPAARRSHKQMPRRKNSFARALADAKKRLEKAVAEQSAARMKLAELGDEIPALQFAIAALEKTLGQKGVMPSGRDRTSNADVTGDSPSGKRESAAAQELTENELLPEPEGTPLTEE
jgi:hypothetical protein